ncbi:Clp protease N-terminal domain-containing protein [Sinomonas sp. B1-1]|uniref:Clp protease N-terminal domain-containing protein n=1 Tax=Sinomonas sp. B1-1 TaxID=3141454 RepID=UPI003D2A8794
MFERFAAAARSTVTEGILEAERRGDRRIGTQHLLLGLLHDPESASALGTSLASARAADEDLDRMALAAVGVDPGKAPLAGPAGKAGRLPFTSAAKDVLARSARQAAAEKSRTITGRHLALALLEGAEPDPAATLLSRLGVDARAVRDRLGQQGQQEG